MSFFQLKSKPFQRRPRPRFQQGVAAVEMGLLTMFLVVTTGIVTEYGRAIFEYDSLAKSARSAARYLATRAPSTVASVQNQYILEARNIALCGVAASCTGQPTIVPNLTIAHIQAVTADSNLALANISTGGFGTFDIVTVTISPVGSSYSFVTLMPLIPTFTFGPISVTMPRVA
jgi:Flp pilus assembly protein TadG